MSYPTLAAANIKSIELSSCIIKILEQQITFLVYSISSNLTPILDIPCNNNCISSTSD
uniref:Uncharacterized protein n=1 Tax=Bartonella rochalimae ATCC BAA-1498 TaxID=685782 RepID=E6YMP6_9HYPH|nr:hypothetical protein BARRO_70031 [Bartonella rochalimae ATCC BAA-1498]